MLKATVVAAVFWFVQFPLSIGLFVFFFFSFFVISTVEGSNTYFFRFTSLSIFRGSKSFNICNKEYFFFFNIHKV